MAKENKNKRLVLLDAHAILHRAYHAIPNFSTSSGEPTGALYGLSSMLMKIIGELKPDYIAACYDLPGGTFRHEVYKEYKAGRKEADDELVSQMKSSREVFEAFGIKIFEHPGFEADDILGTIVEQLKNKDIDIIIASGDMDTLQLVDDQKVMVYTLKKGIQDTILYDEKAVIDRFGFPPKLLPDYKGLRGDPSDNIIGISGIGEKTAEDLIKNFGRIEDMYKTLKKNEKKFIDVGIKPRMIELLKEGEEEAEFSKTLALIRRDAPIKYVLPKKEWKDELEPSKVIDLFDKFEFRSLKIRAEEMFKTNGKTVPQEEKRNEEVIEGMEVKEATLALWVLNSSVTDPGVEDLLNFTKKKSFKEAKEAVFDLLKKNKKLEEVFTNIEKPLIPVIEKMEKRGVKIDVSYLNKLSAEYHKELSKIEKKIYSLSQVEFNINSPKQLSEVLFEKLNLSIKNHKKTGAGIKSTKESELEKMKDLHPIIKEILSYRGLQKLLSTYIDNIPGMVGEDGRLHAKFLQTGSTTGRMSSQNPNLQNIPIKTEDGKRIRYSFVADDGFLIVSLDYSQIELRIAAFLSRDEKLIEIFRDGRDVHTEVASKVFDVPFEKVDKEMRRQAKVINFGILYGMGVNALKENLGSDRATAQKFYNQYFETFSGLALYLDRVKSEALRLGYTETYFGRRRYFEGIKSKIPFIKAAAERMAINAPIQGTQADIIKLAMIKADSVLSQKKYEDKAYLLLQVHDELVYEIKEELFEEISIQIKNIMEGILKPEEISGIKLLVNVSSAKNWGDID